MESTPRSPASSLRRAATPILGRRMSRAQSAERMGSLAAVSNQPYRQLPTLRKAITFVPQIVHETFAGRVWAWRLGVATMLAIAAWIPSRRMLPILLAAISTVLLLFQSITSHAIDKGAYSMPIHLLHHVSAVQWPGALPSVPVV